MASAVAAGGLHAVAGCPPTIAALLKAGSTTLTATVKTALLHDEIAAIVIVVPVIDLWIVPMVQTRRSADFPRLQGDWVEVTSERDGAPVMGDPQVQFVSTMSISDRNFRRFQTLADGRVIEGEHGTFLLDENPTHRAIDFKSWQGASLAIYEVDGDTLKLCVTRNGGPRPDAFQTANGDNRMLVTYRRAVAPK